MKFGTEIVKIVNSALNNCLSAVTDMATLGNQLFFPRPDLYLGKRRPKKITKILLNVFTIADGKINKIFCRRFRTYGHLLTSPAC